MTIKELIDILATFPNDMEVAHDCSSGEYGPLDVESVMLIDKAWSNLVTTFILISDVYTANDWKRLRDDPMRNIIQNAQEIKDISGQKSGWNL